MVNFSDNKFQYILRSTAIFTITMSDSECLIFLPLKGKLFLFYFLLFFWLGAGGGGAPAMLGFEHGLCYTT
jgi:hypothetical protein